MSFLSEMAFVLELWFQSYIALYLFIVIFCYVLAGDKEKFL